MNVTLSSGPPSEDDLQLFRRVMRVIDILQNRLANDHEEISAVTQATHNRHTKPAYPSRDASGCVARVEDINEQGKDDEDDRLNIDDEVIISDRHISDDGNDGGDIDQEALTDDEDPYYHDDESVDHNEVNTSFTDIETEERYDSSDSGDTFFYPDELQHPSNIIDEMPLQTLATPNSDTAPNIAGDLRTEREDGDSASLRCWKHGCNGRKFTTRSNLRRHLREKSLARPTCSCPHCGAVFSRTTARNTHLARGSCNRIRRYSNGRIRPNLRLKNT